MDDMIEPDSPATFLDQTTTAVVEIILGESAPPTREALHALIQANRELIELGDTKAMASALARQATALETGMLGLLAVMAKSSGPEQRLALAKAAATLHGACLRSLSALHQVRKEERNGTPPG